MGAAPPPANHHRMFARRLASGIASLAMLFLMLPTPADAMSTAAEVEQAKEQEKSIIAQYNVVKDPLLNAWVQGVADKLWGQVARRDVPYNIKILDSADINSFTIGGGYLYINAGLLDFVQSDDELAGVIGHETGHVERRHTVTLPAKAQALNLLFGVASIFSPIIYRFGQIAEQGIIAKAQRQDELQADQYGLLLMARAGYDPDAMVSFMNHLGKEEHDHSSLVDKYLANHPGFPSRVSHLVGYEELDPTKRTTDQLLVQANRDQETAQYGFAQQKYDIVLARDPQNATALLHEGEVQLALGQDTRGTTTLGQAAQQGTPETRQVALARVAALRSSEARSTIMHGDLAPLRARLAAAQASQLQLDTAAAIRRDAARDQLKSVNSRIQSISYGIPDFSRVPVRSGTRLDAVLRNYYQMGKNIDVAFGKASAVVASVGTSEAAKRSGLIRENEDILTEMAAPLQAAPIPNASLAILPSYPTMLDHLALADGDMIRALDASRSALALLDVSLGDVASFGDRLMRSQTDFQGDISKSDFDALVPLIQKAGTGLSNAAIASSQAEQLYNIARARQLETRISLLGTNYPQNRYASLRYALEQRVKNSGVDFETMRRDGLTTGEVATASIVAADTATTPDKIIDEARSSGKSIVDVGNERNMSSAALEIFLGLVYLDYTNAPQIALHAQPTTAPAAAVTPGPGVTPVPTTSAMPGPYVTGAPLPTPVPSPTGVMQSTR